MIMAEIGYQETLNINQVAIYRATESDLLRTTVPVGSGQNQKWYAVLRIRLDNLNVNELFDCVGSVEVTNDTGHSVSCVARLVVNSNYDDEPPANSAFFIGAGGGGNVSPSRHHELLLRPVIWIPANSYGARNITLMVRAASSAALPGDTVSLTSAPCELAIKRFRFKESS